MPRQLHTVKIISDFQESCRLPRQLWTVKTTADYSTHVHSCLFSQIRVSDHPDGGSMTLACLSGKGHSKNILSLFQPKVRWYNIVHIVDAQSQKLPCLKFSSPRCLPALPATLHTCGRAVASLKFLQNLEVFLDLFRVFSELQLQRRLFVQTI